MILQVEAAGRRRTVEVSRSGDRFHVSIDGQPHEVDVKEVGGVLSLLIGTTSYDISRSKTVEGIDMVHVDGVPVEVTVVEDRPSWGRGPSTALGTGPSAALGTGARDDGPQRITAPMPGKVVKLLVKAGDRVEPRQVVVVVEAMKMENELRARAAGTVSEVRAVEGTTVEAGAILVVLE
jgi:biotin carboxyl carrier protein